MLLYAIMHLESTNHINFYQKHEVMKVFSVPEKNDKFHNQEKHHFQ